MVLWFHQCYYFTIVVLWGFEFFSFTNMSGKIVLFVHCTYH